jgi:hypothetical protein
VADFQDNGEAAVRHARGHFLHVPPTNNGIESAPQNEMLMADRSLPLLYRMPNVDLRADLPRTRILFLELSDLFDSSLNQQNPRLSRSETCTFTWREQGILQMGTATVGRHTYVWKKAQRFRLDPRGIGFPPTKPRPKGVLNRFAIIAARSPIA